MAHNLKNKLGLRIKELRVANNLTQEKLSELVGMDRTNLTRIESGKHFPNAENLEKFASALNVNVSELFNYGHLKNRDELIKAINNNISHFEIDKIRYIYLATMNLKNLH